MNERTNKRNHKILDHPILGYFLLLVFALLLTNLGSTLDPIINTVFLGYSFTEAPPISSGIGSAVGALAALGIFKLWFRPDFKGCLMAKGFLTGVLMLLPTLVVHYVGSIVSWHTFGTGSLLLAFLCAFAPGFSEEIAFRGLGIANFMRVIRSEGQIKIVFWLSSILFGLVHATNILAGGDPLSCIIQSVYAIGIGMIMGAVYLRTGNLLPCILAHMSLDFMEFIRGDLSESGGVMTSTGTGDWITIVAAAIGAVTGFLLMRPKYYPEIMDIWNKKWNKEPYDSL